GGGVSHEQPVRLEGGAADLVLHPGDLAGRLGQPGFELLAVPGRHHVPHGQSVRTGAVDHAGPADGHLGEFGRHGVLGPVRPGGGTAGAVDVGAQSVRDGGVVVGGGDPEGEHRLVGRVVVAGEHQVRGVGLVGHRETVGRADPAAFAAVGAHRVAGVPHGDAGPLAPVQFVLGGDHQVLAGAGEGGGFAVDLHGLDGSVGEVEVDPVQVGGGPGVDGGDGAQGCVVAAGVVERQVVRRHVVAGVAQVREEAVADAQRGGGGARGDQADGDGRGEQRGGRAPPAGARGGGGGGAE